MDSSFEGSPSNDNRFTPEQWAKIESMQKMPQILEKLAASGLELDRNNEFIQDVYYQAMTQNSDLHLLTEKYPNVSEQMIKSFIEVLNNGEVPPTPPSSPESGVVIPIQPTETLKVHGEVVQETPESEDRLAA